MSESGKEKIAANVVTFNRKQLLGECLDALLNQSYSLDAIYIIDNASTDGTPELLIDKGLIDSLLYPDKEPMECTKGVPLPPFPDKTVEIHYVRMPENTGSSGGQYEGVKRGYEAGFDWLWLMDDDSFPRFDCLKSLMQHTKDFWFLGPLVVDVDNHSLLAFGIEGTMTVKCAKAMSLGGILKHTANPFNGILLSKFVCDKIGFPDKRFFLWGDETEYMQRAFVNGIKVATIVGAIFYHPKWKRSMRPVWGGLLGHKIEARPLNLYCMYRNTFYMNKSNNSFMSILFLLNQMVKFIATFDVRRLRILLSAYLHAMSNRWGGERKYL